jgi:hypothetical protein
MPHRVTTTPISKRVWNSSGLCTTMLNNELALKKNVDNAIL